MDHRVAQNREPEMRPKRVRWAGRRQSLCPGWISLHLPSDPVARGDPAPVAGAYFIQTLLVHADCQHAMGREQRPRRWNLMCNERVKSRKLVSDCCSVDRRLWQPIRTSVRSIRRASVRLSGSESSEELGYAG